MNNFISISELNALNNVIIITHPAYKVIFMTDLLPDFGIFPF